MTDMIEEFDFSGSTGAEVAKEANKGGDFQREIEFLTLKADPASVQQGKDKAIVRLVTEHEVKPWMHGHGVTKYNFAWITVAQHYAPTKPKPAYAREGARWPEKMYAVCRKDKVFAKKFNNQCLICEQGNKASDRTWALGIEREQVIDNGQIIGIRDKMREVLDFDESGQPIVLEQNGDKKTYKKKWVPAWVVLNFGWKNFFNALNGQASYFQSVLGRDFLIQRTGTGNNDTNYTFIPLDPITMSGEWAQAAGVADGTPYDLGLTVAEDNGRPVPLMERLYPDMPDLRKIVVERTSEDYYGRWFKPGWVPEGFDPSKVATNGQAPSGVQTGWAPPTGGVQQQGQQQGYSAPPQQQAPVTPAPAAAPQGGAPSADALEALRQRVTGGGQPAGQ